MKARLFLCSMLLFASFASFAQEEKSFSLELGTGFAPLHSLVSGVRSLKGSLASEGQTVSLIYSPTFALSGVWRINSRSEWLVTGGVTWDYYNVLQYGTFGIDPYGNPRYDLSSEALPAGRKNGDLSASVTIRYRRIWNFEKPCSVYSGAGLGYVYFQKEVAPAPEITLIGVKYSWTHFQLFLENTYGPHATFLHGGIGWRF